MAPEQLQHSHAVDLRADIYSLGATLLTLLSGKSPLDRLGFDSLSGGRTDERPADLRPNQESVQCIPDGLWALLRRMMAHEPNDRHQCLDAVIEALAAYTDDANLASLVDLANERQIADEQDTFRRQSATRGLSWLPQVRQSILVRITFCLIIVAVVFWAIKISISDRGIQFEITHGDAADDVASSGARATQPKAGLDNSKQGVATGATDPTDKSTREEIADARAWGRYLRGFELIRAKKHGEATAEFESLRQQGSLYGDLGMGWLYLYKRE